MSKTKRKNLEKNWDEYEGPRIRSNEKKKKNKRIDRALKTRDISIFVEDDDEDYLT
jgi:hypothetical protein